MTVFIDMTDNFYQEKHLLNIIIIKMYANFLTIKIIPNHDSSLSVNTTAFYAGVGPRPWQSAEKTVELDYLEEVKVVTRFP